MIRKQYVIGNWKMNTSHHEALALAEAVSENIPENVDLAVCPPFPWLIGVGDVLVNTKARLGAQNCWIEEAGAFTGEVSPTMVAEVCDLVIVGHSERRRIFGETNDLVFSKVRAALSAGLEVVVCVGEDLETRQTASAANFVEAQLASAMGGLDFDQIKSCSIAYEPIWAIGTGVAAEPGDAQEMAERIRMFIRERHAPAGDWMRILYGGSVTGENASAILSQPDIDGALVGGASLNAESFAAIVDAASRCV
ncbi:MAG: triose-phosphate isomerase [Thermomicrobiales bacterium]